jgi:hypothetical protein
MIGFLIGFTLMSSVMAGLILLESRRTLAQPIDPPAAKLRHWKPRRPYRTLR